MKKLLFSFIVSLTLSNLFAQGEFTTVWQLPQGQTSISFYLSVNINASYTWETIPASTTGSGNFTTFGALVSVTGLPDGSTIRLKINSANLNSFTINNGTDRNCLTEVEQWGTANWTSMANMFFGCNNLTVTATDAPNFSNINNPGILMDLGNMFRACSSMPTVPGIENWDISNVSSTHGMFFGASLFNQDIGDWNTENVTVSSYMFRDAGSFNQDISDWDMSSNTDMGEMFAYAGNFN